MGFDKGFLFHLHAVTMDTIGGFTWTDHRQLSLPVQFWITIFDFHLQVGLQGIGLFEIHSEWMDDKTKVVQQSQSGWPVSGQENGSIV